MWAAGVSRGTAAGEKVGSEIIAHGNEFAAGCAHASERVFKDFDLRGKRDASEIGAAASRATLNVRVTEIAEEATGVEKRVVRFGADRRSPGLSGSKTAKDK